MSNHVGIYSQCTYVPEPTLQWDASTGNTLWKYDGTAATTPGDLIQYWDECTVPPDGFPLERLLARNTLSSFFVDADGMSGVRTRGMQMVADTRNDMGNAMVFVVFQKTSLHNRENIFGYLGNGSGSGYIYSRQGNPPSTTNLLHFAGNTVNSSNLTVNTKYIQAWQIHQGETTVSVYNITNNTVLPLNVATPLGPQPETSISIGLEAHWDPYVTAGVAPTVFHEIYYCRSVNPYSVGTMRAVIRHLRRKWNVT